LAPQKISIGQVVRLIDGPLAPIACVSQTAYERCTCPDEEHCGLRMIMMDVRNAISDILDRFTLADVVEVTLRKMRRDRVPLPFAAESALVALGAEPGRSSRGSRSIRNGHARPVKSRGRSGLDDGHPAAAKEHGLR
jgi:hypothetical protein